MQSEWRFRDRTFVALMELNGVPVMQFGPALSHRPPALEVRWSALRARWMGLEPHPTILEPVATHGDFLLLRYAALNWHKPLLDLDGPAAVLTAAKWMNEIADAYQKLGEQAPDDLSLFLNPIIKIDLHQRVRLAFQPFLPNARITPTELAKKKPQWNESSIVFIVGSLIRTMVSWKTAGKNQLRDVILKCLQPKPHDRWQSIDELIARLGAPSGASVREQTAAYRKLENAIGWLELGNNRRALDTTDEIEQHHDVRLQELTSAVRRAARLGIGIDLGLEVPSERTLSELLATTNIGSVEEGMERARAALNQGDTGYAAALATEVRRLKPKHVDAALLLAEVHMRNGRNQDAIALADEALAQGETASVLYTRGRVLLAMGRAHEARLSFERAQVLDPMKTEAMLLRREADRAIQGIRNSVGAPNVVDIEVPESLADVRKILLSSDARRVIATLSDARYVTNPDAQLLLARFQAMDSDLDGALATYDRIAAMPEPHRFAGMLGQANTLFDLHRVESALSLFDELCTERPADADASEGRARALERLGRLGEAAAEFRRFISLATVGSDIRVRAAHEWLDAHPL